MAPSISIQSCGRTNYRAYGHCNVDHQQAQCIVLADLPSSRFRLITSDGVAKDGGFFESFTIPFTWGVWILIAASVLILATLLSSLSSIDALSLLTANFIAVGSALIDQIRKPAGVLEHGTTIRLSNIMWLCWLLGVIVITNSYKSKVKSNYILEPKFSTKWQRLEELRDFAVILAYERPKDGFHSWTEGELNRLPPLTFKKGQKFGEQKCPKEGRFW